MAKEWGVDKTHDGYAKELAEQADIPVRMIQHYEQRQKNINKAQAEYLARLSRVLKCNMEELLELVEME